MSSFESRRIAHVRGYGSVAPIWQSEVVIAGDFVFTSAVLATDWVDGIAREARVNTAFPFFQNASEKQTEYILRSLASTLEQAGSGLDLVVKAHVFLLESAEFPGFDRVWKRYFSAPPTRTTVGAAGLLVPGARLEIALIGLTRSSGVKPVPATSDAPRPLTKKVEAMRAGDFVFTSGQLAHNAIDGVPPVAGGKGADADMLKQSAYTLSNILRSLEAAGATGGQVVKTQALLLDARNEAGFLDAYRDAIPNPSAVAVTGAGSLLVGDTIIEIDLTAYTGTDVTHAKTVSKRGPLAVRCGDLIFSAGIFPGVETGTLPQECCVHPAYPHYSSPIGLQTAWVLDRIETVLKELGSDLGRIAKAQVFLTDLADLPQFEQVWRERFPNAPARSVVQTRCLPVDEARIALEVIALKG